MRGQPDTSESAEPGSVRLDLWLWSARFFKTRSLAKRGIEGGKIEVNGARANKPGKAVRVGDLLITPRGSERWEIEILALAEIRGKASEAEALYRETHHSQSKRAERDAARAAAPFFSAPDARPDKRDRRLIKQLLDQLP